MSLSRSLLVAAALATVSVAVGCLAADEVAQSPWEALPSGLELRRHVGSPEGPPWPALVWLVRFNPGLVDLQVVVTPPESPTRVAELGKQPDVLAAINANFFDRQGKALGLAVSDGKTASPLGRKGWGGLSVDGDGRPSIWRAAIGPSGPAQHALQAGPLLVMEGKVNEQLKYQVARRAFVGIDAGGRVVMGVTVPLPTDASALAHFLAAPESEGGVGLVSALNLDGGSSAQLHVRGGRGRDGDLHLPGGVPVPVLLVVRRAGGAATSARAPRSP